MDSPPAVGSLIRIIRGRKVILDRDLARLYGVTTRIFNRAIARNRVRFPGDFMLTLTGSEWEILKSQIGISSWGGDRRAPPYAFTEQGVAMLSSVLRSPRAVAVNIAIMRAFVRLRETLSVDGEVGRRLATIESLLGAHESQLRDHARLIQQGFDAIRGLMETPRRRRRRIGFGRGE